MAGEEQSFNPRLNEKVTHFIESQSLTIRNIHCKLKKFIFII